MAFLDLITQTGTVAVNSYYDQLYTKEKEAAASQFDENLKEEVRAQLRKLGISFENDADFETFVAENCTKITITETNTSMICKDAVVDAGVVTDFGIKLAEWKGNGYELNINSPSADITSFGTDA